MIPRARLFRSLLLIFGCYAGTSSPCWAKQVKLVILQLNDIYDVHATAADEDGQLQGGMARVAALIAAIRRTEPHVMVVHAGDLLGPSLPSLLYKGRQMVGLYNLIGLDAATVGNHEFDNGSQTFLQRKKESEFPWFGANVYNSHSEERWGDLQDSMIKTFDGVNVGLFGVITPRTAKITSPLPEIRFLDPVASAQKAVRKLKAQGAHVIIGLTHLYMNEDMALAQQIPGIHLLLGGHDHTMGNIKAEKTLIGKAGMNARFLGRADIVVEIAEESAAPSAPVASQASVPNAAPRILSVSWRAVPISQDLPEDSTISAYIADYERIVQERFSTPLTNHAPLLDGQRSTLAQQETLLGNLVADAYRTTYPAMDVALAAAGSFRSERLHPQGTLTMRDLLDIQPFDDVLVKARMKGSILRAALEHALSRLGPDNVRFLQVSGMQYEFNSDLPAGSRLVRASIKGSPLEDSREYSVVLDYFLYRGGDGFDFSGSELLLTLPESTRKHIHLPSYFQKHDLKGKGPWRIRDVSCEAAAL